MNDAFSTDREDTSQTHCNSNGFQMTMNMTKEQRITKHKDFLNANWKAIAAFAWKHYENTGRGLVVVYEEDFIFAETPQYATLHFRYIPADDPELNGFPEWAESKERHWTETYDPTERVIVVVVRCDSSIASYFGGGPISPSEAHAMQKALEN